MLNYHIPSQNCIGDVDITDRDVYGDLLLLMSKMVRTKNHGNIMKILETIMSK